ncbi:pyridoxamine 5'-phosphate oxidase family protein [Peribacillus alkalitolerans]|uniref:pyridoxamine 5'-phosphate oxidase family protein n=1 Tax=Peribacillus alkalitolerans TaxID=1550385 RepID=UPI0013D73A49|nr:pyridoxamine 5'-phosphate oxidase family protein [Peribacillus alkalitolerans]
MTNTNERVLKILEGNKVGTLATIQNNKPHSRYMTFFHDGLTLYTATSKKTHKIEELEKNSYVHILLGYTGEGLSDSYIEYEGKAKLTDSKDIIDKIWGGELEKWFEGKDDPNLMILEIQPEYIRLMNIGGDPEELRF